MRFSRIISCGAAICLLLEVSPEVWAADDVVATSVSSRVGNGYKRARKPDGTFKPEYYAISNGGRIPGTTTDVTIDRVTYPEVAAIAMRLLAGQNYHMGQDSREATLLIMLQWGATLTYNRGNYENRIQTAASAFANMKAAGGGAGVALRKGGPDMNEAEAYAAYTESAFESEMLQLMMENRMRDQTNLPNARLLGYLDEINSAGYIPRHTGAATRYDDLIADIEEPRYYIIVSAYDFQELRKTNNKKLLWVTRVSVNARGNRFDDSAAAMLKSAAKYFGQHSGRLIRGEETKGTVEFGDVKFLGEAKEPAPAKTEDGKAEGK